MNLQIMFGPLPQPEGQSPGPHKLHDQLCIHVHITYQSSVDMNPKVHTAPFYTNACPAQIAIMRLLRHENVVRQAASATLAQVSRCIIRTYNRVSILGLYRDNGKEDGNYCNGLDRLIMVCLCVSSMLIFGVMQHAIDLPYHSFFCCCGVTHDHQNDSSQSVTSIPHIQSLHVFSMLGLLV